MYKKMSSDIFILLLRTFPIKVNHISAIMIVKITTIWCVLFNCEALLMCQSNIHLCYCNILALILPSLWCFMCCHSFISYKLLFLEISCQLHVSVDTLVATPVFNLQLISPLPPSLTEHMLFNTDSYFCFAYCMLLGIKMIIITDK